MTLPKINALRIVFALLALVCMITIFSFSGENSEKSSETSGKVTETVVELTVKDYKEKTPQEQESIKDKFTFYVRKCAHFTLYMCLGFCVSMCVGKRRIWSVSSAAALFFCFLYAVSDEIHQSFIPGRSCEFRDVVIDTSGALTGTLISLVIMLIAGAVMKHRRTPHTPAAEPKQ
ncbi:MAG: VanZ family protein [Ruminococcus sp.]|nr:VanZ family protein [Ruminococcus sp.]